MQRQYRREKALREKEKKRVDANRDNDPVDRCRRCREVKDETAFCPRCGLDERDEVTEIIHCDKCGKWQDESVLKIGRVFEAKHGFFIKPGLLPTRFDNPALKGIEDGIDVVR